MIDAPPTRGPAMGVGRTAVTRQEASGNPGHIGQFGRTDGSVTEQARERNFLPRRARCNR